MINEALAGLVTGLTLIVAIGAQNAFVLRQGLRRAHVGAVVTVCTLSDYALIVAGIAGLGAVIRYAPWALLAVRWLGVAFLTWYGLMSAWRARRPSALRASVPNGAGGSGAARTVGRTLALTWLNPHVYLDTVVLLGSIANSRGASGRWWFAAGACAGSTIWFAALGFGAVALAPLLARPRAWQVLDLAIAATMLVIAAGLAFG
jgi:L-lysine exporter family protein LysE/ArgO